MSESKRRRVGASTNSSGGAAAGTADGAGAAASPAVVASPPVKHSVGATFRAPGLVVTDHRIRVPLDYTGKVAADKGKEITVFVREVTSPANARRASSLPALLYLQGVCVCVCVLLACYSVRTHDHQQLNQKPKT